MIARAGVGIDAEALAHHALAGLYLLAPQRPLAPLAVEHALALRDHHLGSALGGGHGLAQGLLHFSQAIGVGDSTHPVHAHTTHRLLDRVVGGANLIARLGRQHILTTGGGGITVVDHQQHVVSLVEDRIAHAAGQAVVPKAAVAHDGQRAPIGLGRVEGRSTGPAQSIAHGGRANVEGRQDGKQVTADVGADVARAELAFEHLEGGKDRSLGAAGAKRRRPGLHLGDRCSHQLRSRRWRHSKRAARLRQQGAGALAQKLAHTLEQYRTGVLAAHGQDILALHLGAAARAVQEGVDVLRDEIGLPLLNDEHGLLALAKRQHLFVDQWIGHTEHIQGHLGVAKDIGQTEQLQGAQHAVVHAALQNDADIGLARAEHLVEPMLANESHRRGPALGGFFLLVQVARRRQDDAVGVALGPLDRVLERECRPHIGPGLEVPVHMAGADAQLKHDRRVAGLGQLEALFHRAHDGRQIGAGIEQPDLRLHGKGVRALLHDARALAVVLADDEHGTAAHPPGGQIGQRIAGHIGAHSGLEGHRTAQGVIDAGRQRGGRGGLGGAVLKMHAQLGQDVVGIREHIHQVRDRCTLVTRDIRHARLQQRLGHSQDAFAVKSLPVPKPKLAHLLRERSFCHGCL